MAVLVCLGHTFLWMDIPPGKLNDVKSGYSRLTNGKKILYYIHVVRQTKMQRSNQKLSNIVKNS